MHEHSNKQPQAAPSHHGHSHHHHLPDDENAIAWAFTLNFCFTIIEFIGGMLTNSTAIMADAVHDLGDSLAIGLAWFLSRLGKKPSDSQYSYGYRRFTLLGSVINGFILILGSVWVLAETIPRLSNPKMPMVEGMFGLAIMGVVVNGLAAFKLSKGKTMAERMLNWHLLEDVLGWLAVLVVSVVLFFVELPILDPILALAFTCFILVNVCKTLYQTIRLFLQAIPNSREYADVEKTLQAMEHVSDIHHLHIWSLDGARHVLSVHLVMNEAIGLTEQRQLKQQISEQLARFEFEHTTIELEFSDEMCRDARAPES